MSNMMNRRKMLSVGLSFLLPGLFYKNKFNVHSNTTGDYIFRKEWQLKDGLWKIYVKKKELDMPKLLHLKNYKICKPFKPLFVECCIGIHTDGRIRKFPTLLVPDQYSYCYNVNNVREKFHVKDTLMLMENTFVQNFGGFYEC